MDNLDNPIIELQEKTYQEFIEEEDRIEQGLLNFLENKEELLKFTDKLITDNPKIIINNSNNEEVLSLSDFIDNYYLENIHNKKELL